MKKTIEIPEGCEARIEGNKVIIQLKETEDEKIRKQLIDEVKEQINNIPAPDCCSSDDLKRLTILESWLAYLEKQKEQKPNPYTGTGFDYNGHHWGMCARDGGVEIIVDGKIRDRVSFEGENIEWSNSVAKEMFIKALERAVEQTKKGYELTDCDKHSWWEDFKAYSEIKPAEYEKPLLSKFEQAVYDCAWDKVTCKSEGETQEEYAKRWAEHLLLMVRDWADDYIDSQIESAKRRAYDKGKTDAEKPTEWSEKDKSILNNIIAYEYLNIDDLEWLKALPERFNLQPKQGWSEEDESFLDNIEEAIHSYYDLNHAPQYDYWLEEKLKSSNHSWKPSEDQIQALYNILRDPKNAGSISDRASTVGLIHDLEKLM